MYVSQDHRFGTDAFLLAYYANVKPDSVVCDLCTGCGIIPLIFCKNVKPRLIYAVDIQPEAIDLLKMSVEKNGLPMPQPKITTRPFSRCRGYRHRQSALYDQRLRI